MRFSTLSLGLFSLVSLVTSAPVAPDTFSVNVKNLYPEDAVYDRSHGLLYQSNLWKGRISAWSTRDSSRFNVLIPGVSSSGDGAQQMAGLSLDRQDNPTRLYGVAKDAAAFRFGAGQSKTGPSSFHAFDLPVSATSTPAWSINLDGVQRAFEAKYGTRPFGPVDSAQDNEGNSYVIFALGIPAIAKVSRDGRTVEPWFAEASNGSQRPGYTGIAFDPATNRLVAFGGPRPLTTLDLSGNKIDTRINGNFGSLDGTEKISLVTYKGRNVLVGAKAPNVYAFTTTDNWASASVKSYTRGEFNSNSLTVATQIEFGSGAKGVYGAGAYFGEGAHGGRTSFPLYRVPNSLLA